MRKYDTYEVSFKMRNGTDLGASISFGTYKEALRYYSQAEKADINPEIKEAVLTGWKVTPEADLGTTIYRKDI